MRTDPSSRSPLSPAQREVWLSSRIAANTAVYNIPIRFTIDGPLRADVLGDALRRLMARHDTLRMSVDPSDLEPVVVTWDDLPPPLEVFDLSATDAAERGVKLSQLENETARYPFDLARPPLFLARLVRLAPNEHTLFVTMHHTIADGTSIALFQNQLFETYAGISESDESNPPGHAQLYVDFVARVTRVDASPPRREQLSSWGRRLAGALPLTLRASLPRPATPSFAGAVLRAKLPSETAARLHQCAAELNATPFQVMLAAFHAALARFSDQDDILVGTPVSLRDTAAANLIGDFLNVVVVRVNVNRASSFAELLARTRAAVLAALEARHIPFEAVVRELESVREPGRNPVFQAMFVHQTLPTEMRRFADLVVRPTRIHNGTAKVDLTLEVASSGDTLDLTLEYNTALFDPATAQSLLSAYRVMLNAAVAAPATPVDVLPTLEPDERRVPLVAWNETRVAYPTKETLDDMLRTQAGLTPDAIAVVFDGNPPESLTYRELESRVARVAAGLRDDGLMPGNVVAACLERSIELVVGLCGIVRAGGAFLLLDPEWPPLRIASVLADAGCTRMLMQPATEALLPADGPRRFRVDHPWADHPAGERAPAAELAYVVFTSGSTGRPKGAMNTHAGLCNRLRWMQAAYSIGPGDAVLQKTPVGFDVSVWEFFWPLVTGARLVVAQPQGHRDPEYLAAAVHRHAVTVLHFVPTMLRLFLAHPNQTRFPSVRRVICSGEALTRDLQNAALDLFGAKVTNLYGPAEASIDVTAWECDRNDGLAVVPIGRPAANCQMYLLDRLLQPVAVGIPADIYIGGVQVGTGYINRPDLTAERFLTDTIRGESRGRLYKTGDIGRYLPNGAIVYEGRADDQVKINGQRIELGEIAELCLAHPNVSNAAVIVSDCRLVAYVVPRAGGPSPTPTDIVRWLAARLPAAIPVRRVLILSALPVSASGKLDRAGLPPPPAELTLEIEYVAPVTPAEVLLVEAWAAVLGREKVGTRDNFFELGGDSIRMIQVLSRCARSGVRVTAAEFYRHPTIAELATCCQPLGASIEKPGPFELVAAADHERLPADLDDAYPLSYIQAALLYYRDRQDVYRVYSTSYHLSGTFDREALAEAVAAVAARHPLLRASVEVARFTEPLVLVHRAAVIPITVRDWSHLSALSRSAAIAADDDANTLVPFDWAVPPLLRVTAHVTGSNDWHLTLLEPWLDGWSVAIVGSEVLAAYAARTAGREITLPPSSALTYRAFVAQEQAVLADNRTRAFWQGRLADAPDGDLHISQQSESGPVPHRAAVDLPIDLTRRLEATAVAAAVPVKAILLAAHLWVVGARTGRREVLTALLANGRPESEGGAEVVGLFLNALPFRFDLGGESWLDVARRAFLAEQEVFEYRAYPATQIQRDAGGLRIDSLFNFTDFHPYRELPQRDDFALLRVTGSDQTYFAMTAQFSFDTARELRLSLDFGFARPSAALAAHLGDAYRRALSAIATDPEQPHAALPAINAAEQHKLFGRNPAPRCPLGGTIHDLFSRQAARTPKAVAVQAGTRKVTYGDLERGANQLAHILRANDVGPGCRVLVHGERSPETLTAFLAVMKAGAMYVPLEPDTPSVRARAVACATRARLQLIVSPGVTINGPSVRLSDLAADLANQPTTAPAVIVLPDAPAYTLFTSGSSGEPKGVCVSHAAVLNRLNWMWGQFPFAPDDVIGFRTPLGFVDSVWELYGGLLAGIPTVILPVDASVQAHSLEAGIASGHVTRLTLVPTLLKRLLDDGFAASQNSPAIRLRFLAVSGEPFPSAYANEVRRRLPSTRLINLYGSTEVSADVTWHEVTEAERALVVPIGKPIDNTVVYVVGHDLRLVPDGVPGELLVGGANLAKGYLDRDDLTAERFIPNPFSPRERVFRTGDLVRYCPNGRLHVLGRLDRQVKVRGVRVEPAEVEAAVLRHPHVSGAAVIASLDPPARLVCYVETSLPADEVAQRLRRFLRDHLPAALIPDQFVGTARLPLNSSGKVDHLALAAIAPPTRQHVKLDGPIEHELAALWAEVLGVEQVSALDDFFDLGGNSLHAIQLLGRVHAMFGIQVSLRDLFDAPALRDLAAAIETAMIREAIQQQPDQRLGSEGRVP